MVNLLDKAILMVYLLQLDQWPHFKESSKLYSLHDLYNITTEDLMAQLKETHWLYSNHITLACHVSTSLFVTIWDESLVREKFGKNVIWRNKVWQNY